MTAGIEFDHKERDAIAAEVNISVLKRSDTAIKCVLKSANHVCLYHLEDNHQWRRLDVEGSLFVVERHLNHQNNPNRHMHRIVIINRKSLNNYTDDIIVGNKHIELADQMIMYSNSKQDIIGIWFYEKAQAHQIFDLLQRITIGDNQQSTSDQSRSKRTPKRPAKPADPTPTNPNSKSDTTDQSRPDNSLERFFPNLKLTNGVAGHQVPQNAKESMFESQAVSTMSTSPKSQKTATAFKPTAEIDEAIITASEVGIPENAVGNSTTTDVKVLASQAMQVVRGAPKTEPKRKTTARPRSSPKPMPPYNANLRSNSHSPVNINGVAKTISPPRSKPMSNQPPSMRPNPSTKSSSSYSKNIPTARQQKTPPKLSPQSKRIPAGKRVQPVKGSGVNRQQVVERPTSTSARTQVTSKSGSETNGVASSATKAPLFQLLTKPKPAVDENSAAKGETAAQRSGAPEGAQAPPKLAVPAATSTRNANVFTSHDAKPQPSAASTDALPSTPNVPISVQVPGAPRAKQMEKAVGGRPAMPTTSASAGINIGNIEQGGAGPMNMAKPLSEEEAMRQMRDMTMRQAQNNMKMQEAQMFAMQAPFPFVSGDLGLGQASAAMMGGGLAGPGGGPSGFAPSLHPQMALMMQQQHQLFMQQQLMAQHHQRHMQLQAGHAAQKMGEAMGNGIGSEVTGSGSQTGSAKTKEESAHDLMRMLNVDRSESKQTVHKSDETKKVESVGASVAMAERSGELGTSGKKLDKVSFRAVVQRMLTDKKLFDGVYEHYLHYHGE